MYDNPTFLITISSIAAAVPVGIWFYLFFSKFNRSKKTVFLVFFLGCLTAPALLGLQIFWSEFPRFNLDLFIQDNFHTQTYAFIATYMLFGAMEEIIKHYVIRAVDKRTLLIQSLSDSLRFSIASALGFAFTENIYYLYSFWPLIETRDLVGMFIFRSVFTTCAHMIFSSLFGYYYAVGKFSVAIRKQSELLGNESIFAKIIGKIFGLSKSHAFQQKQVFKGLSLAIIIHASYNYILHLNQQLPVVIFVVAGFFIIRYLIHRNTEQLVMITDITETKKSAMSQKDEEVVVELISMWFKDGRYMDVSNICERLQAKDPDNKVVALFKTKALDKLKQEKDIKEFTGGHVDLQKNIITNMTKENQDREKVKKMIEKQLIKEGKMKPKSAENTSQPIHPKHSTPSTAKEIIEEAAKGDSFKM